MHDPFDLTCVEHHLCISLFVFQPDGSIYRPITFRVWHTVWWFGVTFTSIMTHIFIQCDRFSMTLENLLLFHLLRMRFVFGFPMYTFFHTLNACEIRRKQLFSPHFARCIKVYTHFGPSGHFKAIISFTRWWKIILDEAKCFPKWVNFNTNGNGTFSQDSRFFQTKPKKHKFKSKSI